MSGQDSAVGNGGTSSSTDLCAGTVRQEMCKTGEPLIITEMFVGLVE